jgi:2'-5' RNA ligase superfamily
VVAFCRLSWQSAAALPAGFCPSSDRCRKFRPQGTLEPYFRAGGLLRMSSDDQGRTAGEAGEETNTGGTARRQSHCENNGNDERHETPPVPVPPPLYHHWTVCVVPPPSPSTKPVWEAITEARTRLHDPGLFRWPPHVNLLYPFVDCFARSPRSDSAANGGGTAADVTAKREEEGVDPALGKTEPSLSSSLSIVRQDVLDKLRKACEQIEPFTVELRHLGTFGGAKRGVLWLDPQCRRVDHDNGFATNAVPGMNAVDEAEAAAAATEVISMATPRSDAPSSPLVRLQRLLEDEFPYCTTHSGERVVPSPHDAVALCGPGGRPAGAGGNERVVVPTARLPNGFCRGPGLRVDTKGRRRTVRAGGGDAAGPWRNDE